MAAAQEAFVQKIIIHSLLLTDGNSSARKLALNWISSDPQNLLINRARFEYPNNDFVLDFDDLVISFIDTFEAVYLLRKNDLDVQILKQLHK